MKANYNHGQKSWDTFEFLGRFPVYTHPAPPLTPQTTLDACFQTFFAPVATLYRAGRENYKKISKRMHCFMVACVQTPSSLVRLLLKGGTGDLYTGYFMREPRKYRKFLILSWILKLWILSRRLLSSIVAISTTIIFLPPMFASLYFYSFPNPPPPLPHFHCFPSTTTRNTTYFCTLRQALLNFAKNNNCVPYRLRDQPNKNENNLKEYWTQLTLRKRELTRARFPIGFLIFSCPYFPRNPCFSLNKLALQFFLKKKPIKKNFKSENLARFITEQGTWLTKNSNELKNKENCRLNFSFEQS